VSDQDSAQREPMTADAIRKLRGRVEWRHPQDGPDATPIVGTCFADTAWSDDDWYVVWSDVGRNWLGGSSWTVDLACFTPLDANARALLEWVSPRRARCTPSSPWSPP
jgi:hypothetical protein